MAKFDEGDRIIITEGAFKGERGVIVKKKLIGEGLTVALSDNGKEIKTQEDHVSLAD